MKFFMKTANDLYQIMEKSNWNLLFFSGIKWLVIGFDSCIAYESTHQF